MLNTDSAEQDAFTLSALQAPVAGDLRAVVSSLKNIADAERIGALAVHVAENRPPPPRPCDTGGSQRLLR